MKAGDSNTKFFHNYAKQKVVGIRLPVFLINLVIGRRIFLESRMPFWIFFKHLFTSEGCSNQELILEAVVLKVT